MRRSTFPQKAAKRHWDGYSWSQVASPTSGDLNAVWGSSADDVWAVGVDILHWRGSSWVKVPEPNGFRLCTDIWGSSGNDVWQVGELYIGLLSK